MFCDSLEINSTSTTHLGLSSQFFSKWLFAYGIRILKKWNTCWFLYQQYGTQCSAQGADYRKKDGAHQPSLTLEHIFTLLEHIYHLGLETKFNTKIYSRMGLSGFRYS